MDAIKAMVRNGRIETEGPLDLPDGTALVIYRCDGGDDKADEWDDTPERIAAWLKWYNSLEPLIFTTEELAALKQDREDRRDWELAHSDERSAKLQRLWE